MIVGYARVATQSQSFDLQLDTLKSAGCERIFMEVASSASTNQKELISALKILKKGDTLIVWRLDGLGKTLKSLVELINGLNEKGVSFRSIVDAIDTATSTGQFFFHIMGSFAKLERNLIHERTMAGLQAARERGRKGGRPKVIDDKTFRSALKLYRSKDISVADICVKLKINKRSFYRYLKNLS